MVFRLGYIGNSTYWSFSFSFFFLQKKRWRKILTKQRFQKFLTSCYFWEKLLFFKSFVLKHYILLCLRLCKNNIFFFLVAIKVVTFDCRSLWPKLIKIAENLSKSSNGSCSPDHNAILNGSNSFSNHYVPFSIFFLLLFSNAVLMQLEKAFNMFVSICPFVFIVGFTRTTLWMHSNIHFTFKCISWQRKRSYLLSISRFFWWDGTEVVKEKNEGIPFSHAANIFNGLSITECGALVSQVFRNFFKAKKATIDKEYKDEANIHFNGFQHFHQLQYSTNWTDHVYIYICLGDKWQRHSLNQWTVWFGNSVWAHH